LADGPLLKKGQAARAHEFHWSTLEKTSGLTPAYRVEEKENREEGFQAGNVLDSYIHLHLGALPSTAPRFAEMCRSFHQAKGKKTGSLKR
jgi:cobyrinic acid a,c-diamide synthase